MADRTYRERRAARAARLQEWAAKREERAEAVLEAGKPFTTDYAFNTQPGHIPFRGKLIAREDRAHESLAKARDMERRAEEIAAQLDRAIYDDDPDAIERLRERVAELEAQREQFKAENAAFRKAHRAELAAMSAYERGQAVPHPAYEVTNLGGNIKRYRDRLVVLERKAERVWRSEAAGGVLVEQLSSGYVLVTFAEKPDRVVIDDLKAAGFRWAKGSWVGSGERMPSSVLVSCTAPGCRASFCYVAGREFPLLCLDHADDASRERHGWTIANSRD